MATKTQVKKASDVKVSALQKPLQLSEELAAVIGSGPLPSQVVRAKSGSTSVSHNLQNPEEPPRNRSR